MLTVGEQEIEEGGLSLETIGQEQLKGAGVSGQDAIQQAPGRRHFVFAGTLGFQIEQDAQLRTRQQLQGDIPMVVLNPIAVLGVNRPLQASRATPAIAGVGLVTVENRHAESADVRQGFVPLQAGVDVMQSRSQFVGGEARVDAPQGVATSGRTSQPPFPEP